jgi:hypothetical protein
MVGHVCQCHNFEPGDYCLACDLLQRRIYKSTPCRCGCDLEQHSLFTRACHGCLGCRGYEPKRTDSFLRPVNPERLVTRGGKNFVIIEGGRS